MQTCDLFARTLPRSAGTKQRRSLRRGLNHKERAAKTPPLQAHIAMRGRRFVGAGSSRPTFRIPVHGNTIQARMCGNGQRNAALTFRVPIRGNTTLALCVGTSGRTPPLQATHPVEATASAARSFPLFDVSAYDTHYRSYASYASCPSQWQGSLSCSGSW